MVTEFAPDTVSHPSTTLAETIQAHGVTRAELKMWVDETGAHVSDVVEGRAPITSTMARSFEMVLGVPATFWLERQRRYDEHLFWRHVANSHAWRRRLLGRLLALGRGQVADANDLPAVPPAATGPWLPISEAPHDEPVLVKGPSSGVGTRYRVAEKWDWTVSGWPGRQPTHFAWINREGVI